jgi:hypothetical protein
MAHGIDVGPILRHNVSFGEVVLGIISTFVLGWFAGAYNSRILQPEPNVPQTTMRSSPDFRSLRLWDAYRRNSLCPLLRDVLDWRLRTHDMAQHDICNARIHRELRIKIVFPTTKNSP